MDRQVEALVREFDRFVKVFDHRRRFGGPSVYFHDRTLERLRRFPSPAAALENDDFVESVYAVLTAWGMHRMGSRGARMEDFEVFKNSLRAQASAISEIDKHFRQACDDLPTKLSRVPNDELSGLAGELWSVISQMKLGKSEGARIVIGSKAIHHLLPELLPPIDRRHTLRFFLGREMLGSVGEQAAFLEIFPRFARIASECEPLIDELMNETPASGRYMRTSATKIIDNAIVGFGVERLRIAEEE